MNWKVIYRSERVRIETAGEMYWKVVPATSSRGKVFRGESAWSDAARLAGDIDPRSALVIHDTEAY